MMDYLYILAGDENLKRDLANAGIRVEKTHLLMIEKYSPEDLSIKDNLREIVKQRMETQTD